MTVIKSLIYEPSDFRPLSEGITTFQDFGYFLKMNESIDQQIKENQSSKYKPNDIIVG